MDNDDFSNLPDDECIVLDEESMALVDMRTGEILGYRETPPESVDDVKLAEWVGERRTYHQGRVAALEAEKQVWIDKINARFDSSIKRHRGAITWFDKTYYGFLFELAKRMIGDGKKRSVSVGLLLLKLRKTSAKTEIVDEAKALAWLKIAGLNDAIKTVESILVSKLPEDLKQKLTKPSNQEKTGLAFYPGGDEELKLG